MKEVILSVGIDIGTSTTQVVFSNITIENVASGFSVPRFAIIDKEIVYRSDIYFTPLISNTIINMPKVSEIVTVEYKKSGFKKEDIKTGAVVITGETARKDNANEVLHHLSGFAGDFVVAVAGPDLESIIAAKGAGTDIYSKQHKTTAANYDIGGGTSNFALFKNGALQSTSCLDIGGRLIKLDPSKKTIAYISPKIKELLRSKSIAISVDGDVNINNLNAAAEAMAEILQMSLGLRQKSDLYHHFLTVQGRDISLVVPPDNISFSGGVADYIYSSADKVDNTSKADGSNKADYIDESDQNDPLIYGDIGILLGRAVKRAFQNSLINIIPAGETIRATVVGAGSHITEISGSTINYDKNLLPLKNLPILKLQPEDEFSADTIKASIAEKLEWFKNEGDLQHIAIAMKGKKSPCFNEVLETAQGIINGASQIITTKMPLVIVLENDMAKILGQTLNNLLNHSHPTICIDAIRAENGDYIDIGAPVGDGSVLPVVIKTLVFH